MKIGSGSTVTLGWRRAICSQNAQCVVARRPSRRPASASRNAPPHTDATRRDRSAADLIHAMKEQSRKACFRPGPPGTSSVSIVPSAASSGSAWTTRPVEVGTEGASGETHCKR